MPRTRPSQSDLLTVEQIADYLQLNKLTIYKYIREGRLPAVKIGKVYRVRRPDIETFLETRRIRPAAAKGKTAQPAAKRPEDVAVGPPPRRDSNLDPRDELISPLAWSTRGFH